MIHHYMPARLTWMMIDSREFGGNSYSCGRHELLRLERGDPTVNDHGSRIGALEGEIAQLKFCGQRLESEHRSCSRGHLDKLAALASMEKRLAAVEEEQKAAAGRDRYFRD